MNGYVDSLKPNLKVLRSLHDLHFDGQTYLQAKADGEFVLVKAGETEALNRWGTVHRGLPCLRELEAMGGVEEILLIGELYASDSHHALTLPEFRKALTRAPEKVKLGLFGMVNINGVKAVNDWAWQMQELEAFLKNCSYVHVLPYQKVESLSEAEAFWSRWVEGFKYEGVIARNKFEAFKIKPEVTIDALVIGVNKKEQLANGRVTSLRLALMDPQRNLIHIGDVSSGIDIQTGFKLYALVKHFKTGEDRETVYVKPFLIVEVRFIDVYPGERAVWRWNGERYISQSNRKFYSLKSPVLIGFRGDKKFRAEDLRLEQIPTAS